MKCDECFLGPKRCWCGKIKRTAIFLQRQWRQKLEARASATRACGVGYLWRRRWHRAWALEREFGRERQEWEAVRAWVRRKAIIIQTHWRRSRARLFLHRKAILIQRVWRLGQSFRDLRRDQQGWEAAMAFWNGRWSCSARIIQRHWRVWLPWRERRRRRDHEELNEIHAWLFGSRRRDRQEWQLLNMLTQQIRDQQETDVWTQQRQRRERELEPEPCVRSLAHRRPLTLSVDREGICHLEVGNNLDWLGSDSDPTDID